MSHDIEDRFINSLWAIEEGKVHAAFREVGKLASTLNQNAGMFRKIATHWLKFNQLPSKNLVVRWFPEFPKFRPNDPFDALKEELCLRSKRNAAVDAINTITSGDLIDEDPEKALEEFRKCLAKAAGFDENNADLNYIQEVPRRLERYEERKEGYGKGIFTTGCDKMDKMLNGGLASKQLSVVAGDPKAGKTWWLVQSVARNYARGKNILVCSPEIDGDTFIDRLDCYRYGLNYGEYITGTLSKRAELKLKRLAGKDSLPLHVLDVTEDGSFTPSKIAAKIQEYQPEIVFIDSAYYLKPDVGDDRSVTGFKIDQLLVKQIKTLAKTTGVHICCVVQMDRDSEKNNVSAEKAARHVYGGDAWLQGCDLLFRLSGGRSDGYRHLENLASREGASLMSSLLKYSFDPYPSIMSVDNPEYEDEKDDEVVEVVI